MYRIGIDLGGTNMKAGIVDENHKIVIQDSIPTRVEHPYKEIIRDMTELVKDLLKKDTYNRGETFRYRSWKSGNCRCQEWYRVIFK